MNPITRRQFAVGAGASLTSSKAIANLRGGQGPIIAGELATRPVIRFAESHICANPVGVSVGDPVGVGAIVDIGTPDSWSLGGVDAADFTIDATGQLVWAVASPPNKIRAVNVYAQQGSLISLPAPIEVRSHTISTIEIDKTVITAGETGRIYVNLPDVPDGAVNTITASMDGVSFEPLAQSLTEGYYFDFTAGVNLTSATVGTISAINDCTDIPVTVTIGAVSPGRALTSLTSNMTGGLMEVYDNVGHAEHDTVPIVIWANGIQGEVKTYDILSHTFPTDAFNDVNNQPGGAPFVTVNNDFNLRLRREALPLVDTDYTVTVSNGFGGTPQVLTFLWRPTTAPATAPSHTGGTSIRVGESSTLTLSRAVTAMPGIAAGAATISITGSGTASLVVTVVAGNVGDYWFFDPDDNPDWRISGSVAAQPVVGGDVTSFKFTNDPDYYLAWFGSNATVGNDSERWVRSTMFPDLATYDSVLYASSPSQINGLLNQLPSTGKCAVVLADGTYNNVGELSFSGFTRDAASGANFVHVRPQTLGGVTFTGNHKVTFQNGTNGSHWLGFRHVDCSYAGGGSWWHEWLVRHQSDYSHVDSCDFINTTYGGVIQLHNGDGDRGHYCKAQGNYFENWALIGCVHAGPTKFDSVYKDIYKTPRGQEWRYNTFKVTNTRGYNNITAFMAGYNAFRGEGADSANAGIRDSGTTIEYNLFDGLQTDPETISAKSNGVRVRFNYLRNCGVGNFIQARMSDYMDVYGNLILQGTATASSLGSAAIITTVSGKDVAWVLNRCHNPSDEYLTVFNLHGQTAKLEPDAGQTDDETVYGYNAAANFLADQNFFENATTRVSLKWTASGSPIAPTATLNNFFFGNDTPTDGSGTTGSGWNKQSPVHKATLQGDGSHQFPAPVAMDLSKQYTRNNPVHGSYVMEALSSKAPWITDVELGSS